MTTCTLCLMDGPVDPATLCPDHMTAMKAVQERDYERYLQARRFSALVRAGMPEDAAYDAVQTS